MDVSLESKSLPSVGNSRKSYLQVTSQKLARGALQGEFRDLDIKYLKQNIRKLQEKFRCTVQNGDLVVNIIRVCFFIVGGNGSGELRVSDEPSCPGNLNCRLRMLSGNSIRIPQEDMWRAPLSGLPQGKAHGTREHHTPDDSISYPDMLSRSLTNLGDETSGTLVLVMIALSSPYQASFLSLCFPDETTDCGVVVEPTKVIDGVVPHDEYRDEMDMMSMSQITEMVQLEPTSPFNLFGVSAIEVTEEIHTVLAPELMVDVTVGDDLFEDTISSIEGASDFMDPPLSFDILFGFISRSNDVYDSTSMDLSIFEYLPVSFDSIYISAPYSPTPQILDIDDEIV
ncbi:hypothetical protein CK203_109513 [Vitis vinifera]|uniref:Uncharacterized protein n=1 Tax=Vitis vinifera TaxID=29760 RepID=A0A438EAJ6_VITVI|nr:hypothetical protein CK203_109513 [Vitis vinifera]